MSDIVVEERGPVTVLTIDRPERHNALDQALNQALIGAFTAFEADPNARVAVVTGAGTTAFCSGADLKTYTLQYNSRSAAQFRLDYAEGMGFGGITRNFASRKPVVAAINGYALSGGLEFALACDVRFCSTTAQFGLQDVNWGFHSCDGGSIRLPHVVGLGNAMEIMLSGERFDAKHALRIGLVTRVYPQDELLERTVEFAETLARRSPALLATAKDVADRAIGLSVREALRLESCVSRDLAVRS